MLFSAPIFLFLFLPLLLAIIPLLPLRFQNAILAVGSVLFYAWDEPSNTTILLASILVNYGAGIALGNTPSSHWKHTTLTLAIIANLSLLAWYKYAGFLADNFNALAHLTGAPATEFSAPSLPLGISFFTFQAISYLIDVYRGKTPPQRKLIDLTLFFRN